MEKEIDRLLKELDGDDLGRTSNELQVKFRLDAIKKAKSMGYIQYFDNEKRMYRNLYHESYYCQITPEGSKLLNVDGGLEKVIDEREKEKRVNKIEQHKSTWTIILMIVTILVSVVLWKLR